MTSICILGIYVADLVFFADKIPTHGESVLGQEHVIGPGGKGSNQSVAVAKAGGKVNFISKIGNDQYGEMALQMYKESNVDTSNVMISKDHATGAAGILVNKKTGENAITVVPGAAGKITKEDINQASNTIKQSSIFLTQLEAPIEAVQKNHPRRREQSPSFRVRQQSTNGSSEHPRRNRTRNRPTDQLFIIAKVFTVNKPAGGKKTIPPGWRFSCHPRHRAGSDCSHWPS